MLIKFVGRWCSSIYSGLPCRRSGVQFLYQPILEKCARALVNATFFGQLSQMTGQWLLRVK